VLQPALDKAINGKGQTKEKWSLRTDDEDPDQQTLMLDTDPP
jgi:hypothetical protein